MFKYSLKKLIFFLPFLGILLCLIFWRSFLTWGMEAYVKNLSLNELDGKFKADHVAFENGTWIFEHPQVEGRQTLAEGGKHFEAEKLAIKVIPHLGEYRLDVEVVVEKPVVHMQQTAVDFQERALGQLSILGILDVHGKVSMYQGSLNLYDVKPESLLKQTIFFQLNADCSTTLHGCLTASLDDPLLQKNCVVLSLAEIEHRHLAMDFNFDKVECTSLLGVASTFLPFLQGLTITEGVFKGKMALTIPEGGRPYAIGELTVHDLSFSMPELEMRGMIKEARIHLDENLDPRSKSVGEGQSLSMPRTIGHLELIQEGMLAFDREGLSFCEINNLKGAVYFQTQDGAKLAFDGKCQHHGQTSDLKVQGEARFASESDGSLDVNFCLNTDQEKAEARFVTRQLGTRLKFAEISFSNVGPAEFDILMAILTPHYPNSRQVHMAAGRIDASALAYMKGLRFTELKIEKIAAKDLQFNVNPWELTVKAGELSGDLAVNLDYDADKALDTLNADLLIKNGQVLFAAGDHDFCQLSDVQTQLTVRQGTILESIVEGEFAGLKGTINLNGLSPDGEIIKLNFTGKPRGLASIAPEPFRTGLKTQFVDDELLIKAGMRVGFDGIKVEGMIKVTDPSAEQPQVIEFGFDLNKASEKLWGKWPANNLIGKYWQSIGQEATLAYLPALASPTALFASQWFRNELGIAGLVVRDGWFQSQGLPLNKYLAPILFPDDPIKMGGKGDLEGAFDHTGMVTNYEFHNLTLENDNFLFAMKVYPHGTENDPANLLPGTHYIDFISGNSHGSFPIRNGTYLERNSGLYFQEIHALASLAEKKLQLNGLQARSAGLVFEGNLEADFTNPVKGTFAVDVNAHTIQGKFSDLKEFFSHFEKLKFFQKFPLEGELELRDEGLEIHMGFCPGKALDLRSMVKGRLKHGVIAALNSDISAKNLEMNFDYDQSEKTFNMTDINGTLVVGKDEHLDEYVLAGDQIFFSNLERSESEFDIWIGDTKRDIVRVVGKTYADEEEDAPGIVQFVFDKELTHFGDVHPTAFDLNLRNWTAIDNFHLELELSLNTLLHDLQSASRTGLFCLPPMLQTELNELKTAKGNFAVNLHYDAKSSTFGYHAIGENAEIGHYHYKKCALHGSKKNCTWSIDQLVLDNLTMATDLTRLATGWKIDFLGLRFGESLLVGLEGEYREGDNGFDAKVNLLEVNLSKLNEWPSMQQFVAGCQPVGHLRATGHMRCELDPSSSKGWRLDTFVNGSLRGWEFKGLHFQDAVNASFHFISDRGLTVGRLKTSLKNGLNGDPLGILDAEKIDYNIGKDELNIGNMHFNIPAENLKNTAEILQQSFPEAFNEKVVAVLSPLKQQGSLQGSFSMTKMPALLQLQVHLDEGIYRYLNHDHDVNNFVLKYDLKELKIITQYRFNHHLFWLMVKSKGPELASGILLFSDHHPEQPPPSPDRYPLRVDWKTLPQEGFQIYKALGHFAGLAVNLTHDPEVPFSDDALHLVGEVGVNPSIASALISEEFCDKVKKWQVEEGYRLNGRWRMGKHPANEAGRLHYHGRLEGYDFILKGYQFQRLSAHLHYAYDNIELRDVKIEDPAGFLRMEKADIYQSSEGDWIVHVPKVTIQSFRPSLLQEVGKGLSISPKPLVVRNLEIENLTGYCEDVDSFTGRGKLQFVNPPKKNLQNTILAIPAEILTMIGLDLTVLNPISGTIFYDINNSKVFLTKFKDVYSEGRLSKFHLSSASPSFVDFDGKLDVSIRMKQYNLFFKLAELFTVNIGGTLKKPTYSLQKQRSDKSAK